MTDAPDLIRQAADLVAGNREDTHGDKVTNFSCIAYLWDAYLEAKRAAQDHSYVGITAHDVANMMELLKVARRLSGNFNPDDYIDGAGYAGCAGEIASRVAQPSSEGSQQRSP